MFTQLIALGLLLGLFFGSIGLFFFGLGCLVAAFRHRLPEIPWSWVVKTRFAGVNFSPRGQTLRRRGVIAVPLAVAMLFVAAWQVKICKEYGYIHDAPAASRAHVARS